jgi:hypothetical protein
MLRTLRRDCLGFDLGATTFSELFVQVTCNLPEIAGLAAPSIGQCAVSAGQVIGIVVPVVPIAQLSRPAVASSVMSHHAITAMEEEEHLRVPLIGRQWQR